MRQALPECEPWRRGRAISPCAIRSRPSRSRREGRRGTTRIGVDRKRVAAVHRGPRVVVDRLLPAEANCRGNREKSICLKKLTAEHKPNRLSQGPVIPSICHSQAIILEDFEKRVALLRDRICATRGWGRQGAAQPPPEPLFSEVLTSASGISWVHDNAMSENHYLPETLGPGCAFLDYDNDRVDGHLPGQQRPLRFLETDEAGAATRSTRTTEWHGLPTLTESSG